MQVVAENARKKNVNQVRSEIGSLSHHSPNHIK